MKSSNLNTRFLLKRFKSNCQNASRLAQASGALKLEKLKQTRKAIVRQFWQLQAHFSRRSLLRMMAAAGIAMGVGFADVQAQIVPNFAAPVTNPFSLVSPANYIAPVLVDLDADGDLDLLVGDDDGNFYYHENTGSATNPVYAAATTNPFGLSIPQGSYGFTIMTLGDIDGDGDLDILRGDTEYGDFYYYQNTGSATQPAFGAAFKNPFGLTALSDYNFPQLGDIDNDGDLDVLSFEDYGNLKYFENTGSAMVPAFAAPSTNPFGFTSGSYFLTWTLGDLDQDGDLDFLGHDLYNGGWRYTQNFGNASQPSFATASNPFNLPTTSYYLFPSFGDVDGDADLDIICTDSSGSFVYLENQAPVSIENGVESSGTLTCFPNPAQSVLNLKATGLKPGEAHQLEVFDLQGRSVLTREMGKQTAEISLPLDVIATGMYEIVISGREGRVRTRFVKE